MKYKLCEICSVITDYVANGSFKSLADNVQYLNGKDYARLIRLVDYGDNYDTKDAIWVSKQSYDFLQKSKLTGGEIIISNVGANLGTVFLCPNLDYAMTLGPNCIMIKTNDMICDQHFLYYYLASRNGHSALMSIVTGSAMPKFNKTDLRNLIIDLPNLEIQKKIVRILSALDRKIELNNQQSKNLFELGRQLYIEKFENDETVDKVELGNFFPVVTGKKDANASSENGKYPFFTCSKTISKIDDYVFDAGAILLAGNGDFNVKFYRGKFDAYQRTYVLIPNNPEYLGFLYWAISYNLPKITANYRGSVIKFITKGNIENFKIPFADNEFMPVFMKYLERIEKNNQQNEVLASLRDALLPKLMSGEIDLGRVL